jgi:hypothetical protein
VTVLTDSARVVLVEALVTAKGVLALNDVEPTKFALAT